MTAQRDCIAMAELPEVVPLKTAQVGLARLGQVSLQKVGSEPRVAFLPRGVGQVAVGQVELLAKGLFCLLLLMERGLLESCARSPTPALC